MQAVDGVAPDEEPSPSDEGRGGPLAVGGADLDVTTQSRVPASARRPEDPRAAAYLRATDYRVAELALAEERQRRELAEAEALGLRQQLLSRLQSLRAEKLAAASHGWVPTDQGQRAGAPSTQSALALHPSARVDSVWPHNSSPWSRRDMGRPSSEPAARGPRPALEHPTHSTSPTPELLAALHHVGSAVRRAIAAAATDDDPHHRRRQGADSPGPDKASATATAALPSEAAPMMTRTRRRSRRRTRVDDVDEEEDEDERTSPHPSPGVTYAHDAVHSLQAQVAELRRDLARAGLGGSHHRATNRPLPGWGERHEQSSVLPDRESEVPLYTAALAAARATAAAMSAAPVGTSRGESGGFTVSSAAPAGPSLVALPATATTVSSSALQDLLDHQTWRSRLAAAEDEMRAAKARLVDAEAHAERERRRRMEAEDEAAMWQRRAVSAAVPPTVTPVRRGDADDSSAAVHRLEQALRAAEKDRDDALRARDEQRRLAAAAEDRILSLESSLHQQTREQVTNSTVASSASADLHARNRELEALLATAREELESARRAIVPSAATASAEVADLRSQLELATQRATRHERTIEELRLLPTALTVSAPEGSLLAQLQASEKRAVEAMSRATVLQGELDNYQAIMKDTLARHKRELAKAKARKE